MAIFRQWWQQQAALERIGRLAEEMLFAAVNYEATVHVRAIVKGQFYGLMFEIGGPFRLDSTAIRAARNFLSERLVHQLNIQLKPSRLFVVFHESTRRMAAHPSSSLALEVSRCQRLSQLQATARPAGGGSRPSPSLGPSSSIPPFEVGVISSGRNPSPSSPSIPSKGALSHGAPLASLTDPDLDGLEVVEFEGDSNDFAASDLFAPSEILPLSR